MAYQLLPFRFERFNDNQYLLTNEVGEYVFLSNDDFHAFVNGKLDEHSVLFYDLAGKSSVSCPLKPSDSAPLKHSTMPP